MGIWKYSNSFTPQVSKSFQISIGEGNTPMESFSEYAKKIDLAKFYLKREDKNPTGSHKDRSLVFQISAYLEKGLKEYVISSSGNAAISAIKCCPISSAKLHVYLSLNLSESKIERLNEIAGKELIIKNEISDGKSFASENLVIHFVKRPKVMAFRYAKENNLPFLRGSTDELAVEGFKTIAFEIFEQAKDCDAVFVPCSSGTSLTGIYQGFQMIKESLPENDGWKIPELHVVQTTKVNTIAKEFDKDFVITKNSLANAIVDKVGFRKRSVIQNVIDTDGFGWVMNDELIKKGKEVLNDLNVVCSNEGAMAVGAMLKALDKGWKFTAPVILITGRA